MKWSWENSSCMFLLTFEWIHCPLLLFKTLKYQAGLRQSRRVFILGEVTHVLRKNLPQYSQVLWRESERALKRTGSKQQKRQQSRNFDCYWALIPRRDMGRKEEEQEVRTGVSYQRGHPAAARSQHSILNWGLEDKLQPRRTRELRAAVCTCIKEPSEPSVQPGFGCFLPMKGGSDTAHQPGLPCVNKQGRLCWRSAALVGSHRTGSTGSTGPQPPNRSPFHTSQHKGFL